MVEPNGGGRPPPGRRPWPVRRRTGAPQSTAEDIAVRGLAAEDLAVPPPPPPPEPLAEQAVIQEAPARFNLAPYRLAALGLALVLTMAIALVRLFVGGPPSIDDLRAQSGVDNWPVLTIGVKDDQPGVASNNDGVWSGFDIDIAYMIAEDLGFRRSEVRFYAIESEDRARMQATDGSHRVPVKMVIASYSITPERVATAGVRFSVPYLYTEQSVITRKGHEPVASLDDLQGRQACTLSASTSTAAPTDAHVLLRVKNRVSDCFALLDAGDVEAVTTDAAILAGYEFHNPTKYQHWDLGLATTEAWGVNVGDNPALQKLVNLTLYRSYQDPKDERWELAYKHNLQVEQSSSVIDGKETPIAVTEQPVARRPDVRVLPWENQLP